MEEPATPNRTLAITLGVLAAVCLAFAASTHTWLENASPTEPMSYGLTSVISCTSDSGQLLCDSETIGEHAERMASFPGTSHPSFGAFLPAAWTTFGACLLAAAGLAFAAALAAAGKKPMLPITPTTIALLSIIIALISGCVFVATKPTLMGVAGVIGVGMSFYVFGAGCILGLAASQLLARVNRPPDPDLMEDAMNPDQF